jgi:hypothetical protein
MPDPADLLTFAPVSEGLRQAFRHDAEEIRAEILEYEEHVADAKRRLANVLTLLAVLDAPSTPETMQ